MTDSHITTSTKADKSSLNRREDFAFVERAKLNDQTAFKCLVEKYQRPLFFHINKIVHDKEILEDLIQEIFLKAFDNIHSFDASYAFSTWLYRIATNHSIDYLRKRKLKTLSLDEPYETKDGAMKLEIADDDTEADEVIQHQQRINIIMDAIESLPSKYRKIIRLRHMEEKSYQEISEIMELPLGTVKAHIFRARELLNKFLKDKRGSF